MYAQKTRCINIVCALFALNSTKMTRNELDFLMERN